MQSTAQDPIAEVTGQFLFYRIGGQEFASRLTGIEDILLVPHITRVPRAPRWLRGVIPRRGDLLSVLDVHEALRVPDVPLTPQSRLLVVAAGDHRAAIAVDSVSESAAVAAGELIPVSDWVGESAVSLRFACDRGGRISTMIDLSRLVTLERYLTFR